MVLCAVASSYHTSGRPLPPVAKGL